MIKIGRANFALVGHDFNFSSCWGGGGHGPDMRIQGIETQRSHNMRMFSQIYEDTSMHSF